MLLDISSEMIKRARESLKDTDNVSFTLLSDVSSDKSLHGTFDFVYSFDVFPHLDLHTIHRYFVAIKPLLKPGGRVFLHTANLAAPLGWDRFAKQSKYTAAGFYFLTPETIDVLAQRTGYRILKRSHGQTQDPVSSSSTTSQNSSTSSASKQEEEAVNMYYQRDYLFVMEPIA